MEGEGPIELLTVTLAGVTIKNTLATGEGCIAVVCCDSEIAHVVPIAHTFLFCDQQTSGATFAAPSRCCSLFCPLCTGQVV